MSSHAVVALSGGMDSATVLAYLMEGGIRTLPASFHYGSKHNPHERRAAEAICAYYGLALREVDLSGAMAGFYSNLLSDGGNIPEGHYTDASMSLTVVPARNIIFLSLLAGIAWSEGAGIIGIGIHQGDHAIYPDCRVEFYKAMDLALYLGTDRRVRIEAPFLYTDKTGILEWGLKHRVPYHLTRTCYKDQPIACGKCGACRERLEAFGLVGVTDPIKYEEGGISR